MALFIVFLYRRLVRFSIPEYVPTSSRLCARRPKQLVSYNHYETLPDPGVFSLKGARQQRGVQRCLRGEGNFDIPISSGRLPLQRRFKTVCKGITTLPIPPPPPRREEGNKLCQLTFQANRAESCVSLTHHLSSRGRGVGSGFERCLLCAARLGIRVQQLAQPVGNGGSERERSYSYNETIDFRNLNSFHHFSTDGSLPFARRFPSQQIELGFSQ